MRPAAFKIIIAVTMLALASVSASSAELAILRNGFSIRHQRHEPREAVTRLYFAETSSGYVEVPTDEIVRFEADDPPPTPVFDPLPAVPLNEMVTAAGNRNHVDPDLIMILIGTESRYNANAVSPKGAKGLMQLMPQTASRLGVENPMDPLANIEGGTRYLRELLDRYGNDLGRALAAYNAGPERVAQYRGVPPYPETRNYVRKIIEQLQRKKLAEQRARQGQRGSTGGLRNSEAVVADAVLPSFPSQKLHSRQ